MYARTERHGHYQVEFYDLAGVALFISSSTNGTFDTEKLAAGFDSAWESLSSQGYLPANDQHVFEANGEHFVIAVFTREGKVGPALDLMRELSAEVAKNANRKLTTVGVG